MIATLTDIYACGLGSLAVQTAATEEPVTLAEVKLHIRVDDNDENDAIDRMAKAARAWCEDFTGRQFVSQTFDWRLDAFPASSSDPLWVPRPKLQSVSSITYVDTAGTSQTWSASNYAADIYSEPGRILPAYGVTWPSTRDQMNAVTIRFVAGYGAASAVPQTIKQAIMLLAGHWYENREAVLTGTISKEVEFSLKSLLWMERVKLAA